MDLVAFLDVDPGNAQAFFDANAIAHESVFTTLLAAGVVSEHYPMWASEPGRDWLEIHYREHLAWSSALGLATPPDLSQLNIESDAARHAWLYNHFLHHRLVADVLRIT